MKKLAVVLILLCIAGVYFYNTIWFQSICNKSFYENIADVPLDVTRAGEQIAIPIKFTFESCYCLGIKVPGRKLADSRKTGKGQLGYQFLSNGVVVAKGVTQPVTRRGWSGDDKTSIRKLMVFNLPFPHSPKDLVLTLEIIEPFSFMEDYKGQTSIVIAPNYEPKAGKCYDEDLLIEY